jgi:hypothetical protein
MSTIQTPKDWEGRAVSTVDLLLFIREKVNEGVMLEMFLGSVNAHAMRAFIEGSSMALQYNGLPDQEFQDFIVWLRDVKKEWPDDGWVKKYLRELGGDHAAAIKKFLDFVAEFAATRKR